MIFTHAKPRTVSSRVNTMTSAAATTNARFGRRARFRADIADTG